MAQWQRASVGLTEEVVGSSPTSLKLVMKELCHGETAPKGYPVPFYANFAVAI